MQKRLLCLCLILALALSLAACGKQADEPGKELQQPVISEQSSQPAETTPESTHVTTLTKETVTPSPIPFTDVSEDDSYYDAVVWAYKNGVASGDSHFNPSNVCTRGEVITFIWRAMGSPEPKTADNPFSDISPSDWYYKPALWAYENGVSANTTFSPGKSCTNAEALTFLWRAEGKPMAAVYSSPIALAASDSYYARPVAWADNNGMFNKLGAAVDPSASCFRSNIVAYLYWAAEQWTFAEEDKAVQAEYEKIINEAQPYEIYGSGLVYADYFDVDGDGKVELLTFEIADIRMDSHAHTVTTKVYANINGHAKKTCEKSFETYTDIFSVYKADDHLYLCDNVEGLSGESYDFYKIGKDGIALSDHADFLYRYDNSEEDIAILKKYREEKILFTVYEQDRVSITNRALVPSLPSPAEYWKANCEQIYAAVLEGDFSYFAGRYEYNFRRTIELDENGAFAGFDSRYDYQKPISVTVRDNGVIHCVIETVEEKLVFDKAYPSDPIAVTVGSEYDIYPMGVELDMNQYLQYPESPYWFEEIDISKISDTSTVRLLFVEGEGTAPIYPSIYQKSAIIYQS